MTFYFTSGIAISLTALLIAVIGYFVDGGREIAQDDARVVLVWFAIGLTAWLAWPAWIVALTIWAAVWTVRRAGLSDWWRYEWKPARLYRHHVRDRRSKP